MDLPDLFKIGATSLFEAMTENIVWYKYGEKHNTEKCIACKLERRSDFNALLLKTYQLTLVTYAN